MDLTETGQASFSALVIDDNWFNRDIFRIALEAAGYSVIDAEDGVQGIAILEHTMFHLLVLDLQMPKMDGRAVLRRVRAMPQHDEMRVLIVTANAHLTAGEVDDLADYVMYKPIKMEEFSHFVRRIQRARRKPVASTGQSTS